MFLDWLNKLFGNNYNAQIIALNNEVSSANTKLLSEMELNRNLTVQIQDLNEQLLKMPVKKDVPKAPVWLDQTKGNDVYEGYIQLIDGNVSLKDKRMIYAFSDYDLQQWQVLKGISDDETLQNIQNYVCKTIPAWVQDKEDDWQFPSVTISRKPGSDCEDGAILFVTIANALGISDCWLACGEWNKQGHAWPIALWKGSYYVFETVTHPEADNPLLFKGSTYMAMWGVSNSYFMGFIVSGGMQV